MDNLTGKALDERYLIGELIGSGGMANVYQATDLQNQRTVAVKILREECRENSELVRRFKNESKAISILNHPNIVKVYDVSVQDDMQYIVMEYIDGITLKEYMEYRGQPLTYKETLHFITQILAALQHAHETGIVHRDVKPQNIMLLADSSIKVMDFGIARFSRSENQTMTDKAIGSVHYISPEQARGGATDAKADIYSVGVMMYEMLAGRLPFESDSPVSVAIQQIADAPTPLRELNPAVPEALAAITERAMAKDPRERYPSAQDMLADIEEFRRNPSVKFEYQYMDAAPTRYVDKVVSKTTAKRNEPAKSTATRKKRSGKRKRRLALPILAGIATAFLIGAAILVYVIFKYQGNGIFSQHPDVDLPNFIGMTIAEIKERYPDTKFTFQRDEDEYNNEYAAGVVCDQYPRAQTAADPKRVKENARITLTISKGVKIVDMPDLKGRTRAEATTICRDLGLLPTFRSEEIPNGQAGGTVLRTDPAKGTQVEANTDNSNVTVYIGMEALDKSTVVPDLRGLTSLEDVQSALREAQLMMGTYSEEYNDTVPAGAVISQSPEQYSSAQWNDSVSVVISKGPETRTIIYRLRVESSEAGKTFALYFDGANPQEWVVPTQSDTWPCEHIWQFTDKGVHTVTLMRLNDAFAWDAQTADFSPEAPGEVAMEIGWHIEEPPLPGIDGGAANPGTDPGTDPGAGTDVPSDPGTAVP